MARLKERQALRRSVDLAPLSTAPAGSREGSMWRDPLDELIDDLERVAPDPRAARGGLLPFLKLQALTDAILYGTPDQVETLMADPEYQRWLRHCAETRRRPHADPPSASGLASLDRTVHTGGDD